MSRVLSHIIQKRFSQVNEDVATDALAYILESSPAAKRGMGKLLRGLIPDLADLKFKTQEAEGLIRPDMWGYEGAVPRVFIENKFWAGLTDNQPVNYLKRLADYPYPTVLLVVAPSTRVHSLWRELQRRVSEVDVAIDPLPDAAGVQYAARTNLGPILAVISWDILLSLLEHETSDDPEARGDLIQLRSLCQAADIDAFSPISREELSDQRMPAFMLDLSSIWQEVTELGISRGILDKKGLLPQASPERIGRYISFSIVDGGGEVPVVWFGIHFRLWKKHGITPLWGVFVPGRAEAVKAAVEPWASRNGVYTADDDDGSFVVALDLPAAEERDAVIEAVLERFNSMRQCWMPRCSTINEHSEDNTLVDHAQNPPLP